MCLGSWRDSWIDYEKKWGIIGYHPGRRSSALSHASTDSSPRSGAAFIVRAKARFYAVGIGVPACPLQFD